MNEYLEQAFLNCINSSRRSGKPQENSCQWIVDEDDSCFYMEGNVNGIKTKWTIEKK